jgi:hypothetical protein
MVPSNPSRATYPALPLAGSPAESMSPLLAPDIPFAQLITGLWGAAGCMSMVNAAVVPRTVDVWLLCMGRTATSCVSLGLVGKRQGADVVDRCR